MTGTIKKSDDGWYVRHIEEIPADGIAWMAHCFHQSNNRVEEFVNASIIFNLDEHIILNTIEIRKTSKIKLPDAIIGATALLNNLTLITSNKEDFKNILGLRII